MNQLFVTNKQIILYLSINLYKSLLEKTIFFAKGYV